MRAKRVRVRVTEQVEAGLITPYNIRVKPVLGMQIKQGRAAKKGVSWAEWMENAADRFLSESEVEQASLIDLAQKAMPSQGEKEQVSFRVKKTTMEVFKKIAEKHNSSIQAVVVAAMHLYSFVVAVDVKLPK